MLGKKVSGKSFENYNTHVKNESKWMYNWFDDMFESHDNKHKYLSIDCQPIKKSTGGYEYRNAICCVDNQEKYHIYHGSFNEPIFLVQPISTYYPSYVGHNKKRYKNVENVIMDLVSFGLIRVVAKLKLIEGKITL